jgi:xanthine dehydrogenase molybdopterin-binding subunit B
MKYVKVLWSHEYDDEPVLFISEIGDDGYEVRKVEFYRDGRSEWADEGHETSTVGLSEIAFVGVDEMSMQAEFDAEETTVEEFESVWASARGNAS